MCLCTCNNEDKCWVKGDVSEAAQVVECVLLGPGPDTDGQDAQPHQLQEHKKLTICIVGLEGQ